MRRVFVIRRLNNQITICRKQVKQNIQANKMTQTFIATKQQYNNNNNNSNKRDDKNHDNTQKSFNCVSIDFDKISGNEIKEANRQAKRNTTYSSGRHLGTSKQYNNGNSKRIPSDGKSLRFKDQEDLRQEERDYDGRKEETKLCDIIGNFGLFQLLILLFSGIREGAVGYDAVITSVMLQPERNFLCTSTPEYQQSMMSLPVNTNNGSSSSMFYQLINDSNKQNVSQCLPVSINGHLQNCHSFAFEPNKTIAGSSLVVKWSLVCDRSWLVVCIQSAYFLGLLSGNMFWGYYADIGGRRKAYLCSHLISLIFGLGSVFATNVYLFVACRFVSAFGNIGYNMLYTIQIELLGTKYRSTGTVLNHFGWGLGIILVPVATHTLKRADYMLAVTPTVVLLT